MAIIEKIQEMDFANVVKEAKAAKVEFETSFEDIAKQYDVLQHDVFDPALRKDKIVKDPITDDSGNPVEDADGNQKYESRVEKVVRVGMPYQKIIVQRRVGFLLGNNIELEMENRDESTVFNAVKAIWDDNKLDYKNKELAERLFSERECAEIWFKKEDAEFWKNEQETVGSILNSPVRMKMLICSPSNGDELYPVFDEFGDMIVFVRSYTGTREGKPIEMLDVYTNERIYYVQKVEGNWVPKENGIIDNQYGKIPVIYYRQKNAEWYDVQSMIDRREASLSTVGDTVGYFGQPILFFKGEITGFAGKTDSGKVFTGDENSSAQFLSWDNAPENTKMELNELEQGIFKFSQTPDISFENIQGLGAISGRALKFMFMDAQMAARVKETIFGIGIQRRVNLMKAMVGNLISVKLKDEAAQIKIKPVFTPYIPEDDREAIELLSVAKETGILSRETAVGQNPFVADKDIELERIKSEEKEAKSNFGESFNL